MSIKESIQDELRQLQFPFPNHILPPDFKMPSGYFERLPGQVLRLIQEEEKLTAITAVWPKAMPFSLPEGYFYRFPTEMQPPTERVIAEADAPWRLPEDRLPAKAHPFQIPDGYFSQLPEIILAKIPAPSPQQEIEALSPLLAELQDKTPFQIPDNYFDAKPPATVKLHPAQRSIKWTSWVAAAAILIIFGIGGFRLLNQAAETPSPLTYENALAGVSDEAIQEYLALHLNDYELAALAASSNKVDKQTDKELFDGISDEEIENYLEEEMLP